LTDNPSTLAFGGAPPDTLPLAGYQCVLETRFAHRTCATNLLRRLGFFICSRKEDVSVHATACATVLPGQLLHTDITSSIGSYVPSYLIPFEKQTQGNMVWGNFKTTTTRAATFPGDLAAYEERLGD